MEAPDAADEPAGKREAGERPGPKGGDVAIELEVSRQHAASMAAFCLVVGALLIWKLGTVGVWVGIVLLVFGAFRIWELVQSFLYAPGTIVVTETTVSLPRGLCLPRPVQVTPADVTAVYFLRKSVPWNRSAPVLVVEVGDRALPFPRDWFASEADQRHVVHALLRGLPEDDAEAKTKAPASRDKPILGDDSRAAWALLLGGLVLLGAGLAGALMTRSQTGAANPLSAGPIVTGAILCWRGFSRW